MICSIQLIWNILLSIFTPTSHAITQRLIVDGSNIDSISTPVEADNRSINTIGPTALSYAFDTTTDVNVEDAISLHYGVTMHGLHLTNLVETSSVFVDHEVVPNIHMSA